MEEAVSFEPSDPNAMCLSTVSAAGRPSSRIMLLKGFDEHGFVFFTNLESRKGQDLKENPVCALNFHWKSMGRQVRIEGSVEQVSDAEADAYFRTRPRGSRIGAWASKQSSPMESREEVEKRIEQFNEQFTGDQTIPRPPYWSGFRVVPDAFEFWLEGEYRLHHRLVFRKTASGWEKGALYP